MSIAEIILEVEKMSSRERRELVRAIEEAERQDADAGTINVLKGTVLPPARRSFAEAAAHLIGGVESGIGDLSTNKQHLEGLGRD